MSVISLKDHRKTENASAQKLAATVLNLPVAPQVVARTRFSPPPPPQSQCMMVPEAMELLHTTIKGRNRSEFIVTISGPGDPLATPDITLHTIRQIRRNYDDIKIGLKSFGIGSEKLAGDLARAGLNFLEMQVDGVKAEILEKLYAWIRPGQKTINIVDGAELLIREQRHGVPALKFHELSVSIHTTLYPGYNLDHVVKISSEMMELGADSLSMIQCCTEPGIEVELEAPEDDVIVVIKAAAEQYLPIVGPLIPDHSGTLGSGTVGAAEKILPKPSSGKPNVAVASSNGIEVDLHLGHAVKFLIYGPREDGLTCLLEARDAPEPGSGTSRWIEVANLLNDCFVLLVASVGETPRRVLAGQGLKTLITEENIEGIVDVLYGGGKKEKKKALEA
ncbi:MAG: NifB/NifX family molybdenum-iron cluster-binding protein [Desulforhopalus sp.]